MESVAISSGYPVGVAQEDLGETERLAEAERLGEEERLRQQERAFAFKRTAAFADPVDEVVPSTDETEVVLEVPVRDDGLALSDAPEGEPVALEGFPEVTPADLDALGTGLPDPPPTGFWNEGTVGFGMDTTAYGDVADPPADRMLGLSAGSREDPPKTLTATELIAALKNAGIPAERIDPAQLVAAVAYVNEAPAGADEEFGQGPPKNLAEQAVRLGLTIKQFKYLDEHGAPTLTREQTQAVLWSAGHVPSHALANVSDADLPQKTQEVARALVTPGEHEIKVGKHTLEVTVADSFQLDATACKAPSAWGTIASIGKFALGVAKYIPGPVGAAARVVDGAINFIGAIKDGDWSRALGSLAGTVGAGANFLGKAGKLGESAVKTINKVTDGVEAVSKGVGGIEQGGFSGTVNGLASVATGVAGISGEGGDIAKGLTTVGAGLTAADTYTKANRAVADAQAALDAARASGDPAAITAAEISLAEAEKARRSAVLGGLATVSTLAAGSVGGTKADGSKSGWQTGFATASEGFTAGRKINEGDYFGAAGTALGGAANVAKATGDSNLAGDLTRYASYANTASRLDTAIDNDNYFEAAAALADLASTTVSDPGMRNTLGDVGAVLSAAGSMQSAIKTGDWLAVAAQGAVIVSRLSSDGSHTQGDFAAASRVLTSLDALRVAIESKDPDRVGQAGLALYQLVRTEVNGYRARRLPPAPPAAVPAVVPAPGDAANGSTTPTSTPTTPATVPGADASVVPGGPSDLAGGAVVTPVAPLEYSEGVRFAQSQLNDISVYYGWPPIAVDGLCGPETRGAIERFQGAFGGAYNLKVTGKLDTATENAISNLCTSISYARATGKTSGVVPAQSVTPTTSTYLVLQQQAQDLSRTGRMHINDLQTQTWGAGGVAYGSSLDFAHALDRLDELVRNDCRDISVLNEAIADAQKAQRDMDTLYEAGLTQSIDFMTCVKHVNMTILKALQASHITKVPAIGVEAFVKALESYCTDGRLTPAIAEAATTICKALFADKLAGPISGRLAPGARQDLAEGITKAIGEGLIDCIGSIVSRSARNGGITSEIVADEVGRCIAVIEMKIITQFAALGLVSPAVNTEVTQAVRKVIDYIFNEYLKKLIRDEHQASAAKK